VACLRSPRLPARMASGATALQIIAAVPRGCRRPTRGRPQVGVGRAWGTARAAGTASLSRQRRPKRR